MSSIGEKALNALQRMEYFVNEDMGIKTFKQSGWHIEGSNDYEIVKDTLLKYQELEKMFGEYKESLDIIFTKNVDIIKLKFYIMSDPENALDRYNTLVARDMVKQLTSTEFFILKRYIINIYLNHLK